MQSIIFHPVIDSTNTEASRILDEVYGREGSFSSCHKDIIWTQKQTAGRGRLNRPFFSPESGAYMSFIYCPSEKNFKDSVLDPAIFTATAAVSVCRAIKNLYNKECSIKWVNDIYVGPKKVCGILTEGKIDGKKNRIGALVIGIGVNIWTPENNFPPEIRDRAGSVLSSSDEANNVTPEMLVSEIARETFSVYDNPELIKDYMREYKARSNLLGKKIFVTPVINQTEGKYEACVQDITEDARLVVQDLNGEIRLLSSGEVTLHV